MGKYQKDFRRWAEVAEEIEGRERLEFVKVGAVYWCKIGPGIGHELVGKGWDFTRPVLVIGELNVSSLLVLPITSQTHVGANYLRVVIDGRYENLALAHLMTVDKKRIGSYIDEVDEARLRTIRNRVLKYLERRFAMKRKMTI